MPVIPAAAARRSETPNAVMTTLASPAQGGAAIAVWRVDMRPGASGPLHTFDAEQVWTVLAGAASVDLGGERVTVAHGDTVVMPAATPRQVVADASAGLTALVAAPAGCRASTPEGGDAGVPPWIR